MKFKIVKEESLEEGGLSRILQHVEGTNTFAIIGSQDKDTRKSRYFDLLDEIGKLSYRVGFNNLQGTYTYEDGKTEIEDSLIIYNIKKEDAIRIAKKLNQESIIWHDDSFFGFLTSDGVEDGELGKGLSFDEIAVQRYGSRIKGKHNKSKPWVFEAFLVETTNVGSNISKHHKSEVKKYKLFEYKES